MNRFQSISTSLSPCYTSYKLFGWDFTKGFSCHLREVTVRMLAEADLSFASMTSDLGSLARRDNWTRENCSSPWSSSLITNGLNSFMMKSYPIRRDELGSRLRFVVTWSLGFALRKASNMGDLECPVPKVWVIQVLWQQKSSRFEQISVLWKPTTLGSIEKVLVWILVYRIFPYAVKSLQASSWNELGLMIFSL